MTLRRKILLMVTTLLLMTVGALGIYFTTGFNYSMAELSKTFQDFEVDGEKSKAIEQTEPFSILLMGVDTGKGSRSETWSGNSDTMILVTVNPKTKRTTMTSLERDILVTLSGPETISQTGMEAKLNAAYMAGGAQMALMTVQDLLDIKIDKYMQINMQGLVDLVEAVGGITVTNDFDFPIQIETMEPEYTATVAPGTHKINGDQALVYARMRYDDPEGDYGRQRRQREVISKVLKKVLAMDSVSNYRKVLKAISGNMRTNIEITTATIPSLLGYRDALKNVKSYQLRGQDATINGGSYQLATHEHLLEIQNRIKSELGVNTKETLTTNALLYQDVMESGLISSDIYGYVPEIDQSALVAENQPVAPTDSLENLVSETITSSENESVGQ